MGKRKPELISEKLRRSTYSRRIKCLKKKAYELHTLCGTDVLVVAAAVPGEAQPPALLWPEDPAAARAIAARFLNIHTSTRDRSSYHQNHSNSLPPPAEEGPVEETASTNSLAMAAPPPQPPRNELPELPETLQFTYPHASIYSKLIDTINRGARMVQECNLMDIQDQLRCTGQDTMPLMAACGSGGGGDNSDQYASNWQVSLHPSEDPFDPAVYQMLGFNDGAVLPQTF